MAYAQGKQSQVIDLDTDEGRAQLAARIAEADVLLESCHATERARLGLTYEALKATNPGLVCVAITPFGMDGPKAAWPATDLTVWAASGAHELAGDADRAPGQRQNSHRSCEEGRLPGNVNRTHEPRRTLR